MARLEVFSCKESAALSVLLDMARAAEEDEPDFNRTMLLTPKFEAMQEEWIERERKGGGSSEIVNI